MENYDAYLQPSADAFKYLTTGLGGKETDKNGYIF